EALFPAAVATGPVATETYESPAESVRSNWSALTPIPPEKLTGRSTVVPADAPIVPTDKVGACAVVSLNRDTRMPRTQRIGPMALNPSLIDMRGISDHRKDVLETCLYSRIDASHAARVLECQLECESRLWRLNCFVKLRQEWEQLR